MFPKQAGEQATSQGLTTLVQAYLQLITMDTTFDLSQEANQQTFLLINRPTEQWQAHQIKLITMDTTFDLSQKAN